LRVAVAGLGLIGGSIALAARTRLQARVSAWDPDRGALDRARAAGVLDRASSSLAEAVADADAVFVAAPVGALPELIAAVLSDAPADCAVSDTGSTKRSVVSACADPRFVGGHPLAGAAVSGVEHARAELFDDATWYLTPGPTSSAHAVDALRGLIAGLGARPTQLSAEAHDRLMAAVSQLPHVFADTLVTVLAREHSSPVLGPSFLDATRVAAANPTMWSAIYNDNRDELTRALEQALGALSELRDALVAGDRDAVAGWCERAAQARRRVGR